MSDNAAQNYQVLARKYRPQNFADLIGQGAMVRTLKNAFAADRIAHAFIMTGVRGVGKTTTARIIAKGLNCTGLDGKGGPTTEPCGQCEACRAIAEGRHVDVLEMDAASRTGVGDIREIIDSVHYRAASARYKIYIIDEVHMLSTSAFNALLKTLEEPPAHVKFIFATTEIRKVPVTVLSRCQRFDLRRIEPDVMIAHLEKVAAAEGARLAPGALMLIARAAEGSVRDAMSLLDQAIAHGGGETSAEAVRAMLGLADRARVLDLFDHILAGRAEAALSELSSQYADGADPLAVLRDLAEITHWVSTVKITPSAADDVTLSPEERARGQAMAEKVPMRALSRLWQMLLKALEEVALAPNAMMAAEMALIRMTYIADLPDPEALIRRLQSTPSGAGLAAAPAAGPSSPSAGPSPTASAPMATPSRGPVMAAGGALRAPLADEAQALAALPQSFEALLAYVAARRDIPFQVELESWVRLVRYAPGRIEFEPAPGAPADFAAKLGTRLQGWTGQRWAISLVSAGGAPSLAEARAARDREAREKAADHPLVQAILTAFPGAKLADIRPLAQPVANPAIGEAADAGGAGEDWDPFEEN